VECLYMWQDGTYVSVCNGVMLENNNTSTPVEQMSYVKLCDKFSFQ